MFDCLDDGLEGWLLESIGHRLKAVHACFTVVGAVSENTAVVSPFDLFHLEESEPAEHGVGGGVGVSVAPFTMRNSTTATQ